MKEDENWYKTVLESLTDEQNSSETIRWYDWSNWITCTNDNCSDHLTQKKENLWASRKSWEYDEIKDDNIIFTELIYKVSKKEERKI